MQRERLYTCLILSTLTALSWSQVPTLWPSTGIGGGGALFAPTFSPYNSSELTLACDMSPQFHTTNLGQTWTTTTFAKLQSGRTSQKVQYTSDAKILYNLDFRSGSGAPVKSTDGGVTWKSLPADPTGGDAWYLVADSTQTNRLLLTSYASLYLSLDGGKTWKGPKATIGNGNGFHIAGSFFNGNQIFVATENGLLVSSDNGATFSWSQVPGIPNSEAIVSFAASKAGSVSRFSCVTLGAGQVYSGIQGDDHNGYRNVYTIDWGSKQWTKSVSGIPVGAHPFFVGMARNNVNTIYLAGGSVAGVPVILKSTNGGGAWTSIFKSSGNANINTGWSGNGGDRDWGYGELAFGFDVCPTDVNRITFTDYGFCHLSVNGGTLWSQAYVASASQNPSGSQTPKGKSYQGVGLEDTSCWTLGWSDANNIFAGFSDVRGIRTTDAGKSWSFNYSGFTSNSSYQVVIHPTTKVLYMATSSIHDMYESTHLTDARIDGGVGDVLFSANKGQTWTKLGSLGKTVMGISLDPTNAKRIYASVANSSVGGIYVCQDITKGIAATWLKLAAPPRTQGHAFNITVLKDGSLVCSYSGRRTTNFTDSSGIFISKDQGKTWVDRSAPNMHWWTKDLTIDPTDAQQNTWYACVYSGWGGSANNRGGLYRTTNRGVTWTNILVRDRVGSCSVNPKNANEIYAATETEGLWYSNNLKASTPVFSQVTSYPFRQPERIFFNPFNAKEIWVTSFGNGIRVGTIPTGP